MDMEKRRFLKTSGALVAGSMLPRLATADAEKSTRTNWSGNYQYHAERVEFPHSVAELQKLVRACTKPKALGTRHSFNGIADTSGTQISLKHFKDISLDSQAHTVTVGAGVSYGDLSPYLYQHGYALQNLASLPHISVAGGTATATHGSGLKNGNLATPVSALELVTANGDLVKLSRQKDGDRFHGSVVHLGGLGVVSKITLDLQPAFDMRQVVYENLPFDQLKHHLDDIFGAGYSVSLFTDWQNHRATQVWIKSRVVPGDHFNPQPEFFGATLAKQKLHPIAGHSAENCTEQLGIPGPWYERLPHFRMNFTPSSGNELQSEYFVPREKGYDAILAVEKLRDRITPHLFITELRTIAADDLWMSPCYRRAGMTIHFTWKPEWPAVKSLLPLIEEQLAPFDPRPHWAKLYTLPSAKLQSQYERLSDFRNLLNHHDPTGKFHNAYLNAHLFNV